MSSFSYHIDGQIASAVTPDKKETFQWDGLALIQRNETNYVNEPAITGGNPILAGNKVLFNDLLGTTLGAKDGDQFTRNDLTAFGESLNSSLLTENSFFTGKPYIGELGYAFLFRNYRADQGKWNSQDPVALAMTLPSSENFGKTSQMDKLGYPDGWNNLAYVNNNVTMYIDWQGCGWVTTSDNGAPKAPPTTVTVEFISGGGAQPPGYNGARYEVTTTYQYVITGGPTGSDWDQSSTPSIGTVWTIETTYTLVTTVTKQLQWRNSASYQWENRENPTVSTTRGPSYTRKQVSKWE